MTLKDWLKETRTPYGVFALKIGVANGSVVERYANKGRVPRSPSVRSAIVRETGGKVQLEDIYAAAAAE